ncbi:nitrate/nitrite transporter [Schumannella sp. 10F1B-5-1]|uniref:MFS transporter n=1 Tax=Schumannella sp. 10F1B-5-1 TaxID=2590780 RepID=UPI0011310CF5|nr:MFS transporter [Schumannella sp. 10F1B-5-1]TPW70866.1 MFS transporter [Schumannella sp. 10F1B-5-1]
MNSLRSWIVLGGAVLAYLVSVTQRTSFGVAGVPATERFDVSASAISTVAVVQVVVYAAMQVPVGVLVDRIGSKSLLLLGAALMAGGTLLLAFSTSLGAALVARMLVGAGDAVTFVSVIRLLPFWFQGRIVSQLSQWIGTVGQLGQILSALPFALLLREAGWTPAFSVLAGVSVAAGLVVLVTVRRGEPQPLTGPMPTGGMGARLLASLRRPGTQLGFWVHLIGGTPTNVIAILWGYPMLTAGLGYGPGPAAAIMSLLAVGALIWGPLFGFLIARFPLRRSSLILVVVTGIAVAWAVLLLWPGTPPLPVVVLFFLAVSAGGPGSLIGFDVARSFNPSHAFGSASGIVNVGGFTGGFVSMLLVGVTLDSLHGAGVTASLYDFDGFRIALIVPGAIVALGIVGLVVARRRTRARMYAESGIEVAPLWVALFRRWRAGRTSG